MEQAPAFEAIDGDVGLRWFTLADVPYVTAACQDDEIIRWTAAIPSPYTEAHARWWIEHHEKWRDEGASFNFAIVSRDDDRLKGSIGIESVLHPPAQVGYWVAPWARNQRFASRALGLVTTWAFERLNLDELSLVTKLGNERSERVAQSSGFRLVDEVTDYRPVNARDSADYHVRSWRLVRPN